nr:unnamed protein product [Callosobruchus analis]
MSEDAYLELLQLLVTPIIKKQDTNTREAKPHERLSATIRFLATGSSYQSLFLLSYPYYRQILNCLFSLSLFL